jgi:predicted amidohydrolase YtcJ
MPYADTLISGGRVFRGLREGFAEAIAISGPRIVACGARAAVEALAGPGTRRIDLSGRVAIPAFNDAHQHLLPMGLSLAHVNLRAEANVRTLDDLLARIRAAARAAPRGAWVLGRGYDQGELDVGRHPTAEELTAAAPDNPVFIVRACGHVGVANKAALQLAEVGHNTPDPEGGAIERRNGALTGLFQERAMRLIKDMIPDPSDVELRNAITLAGEHMLGLGVTSVMDANVGMAGGMREIAAYRALHAAGRLPVRVWMCLNGNPEGIADAAWREGIRPGDGDDMLRFGAIKVFGDGSAGGLTAAMSEPYLPGGTGIFCFPTETMHELLATYHRQGWQLAIHAIGDAAIEQVLSGMEAADTEDRPVGGRRHRIEHCGFLSAGQIARMTARGIEPVPQPIFMYEFGDLYVRNVGLTRAEAAYPMRSWLDAGQNPAASSDAPVSTTDPFRNIFTQVTRKTNRGTVLGGDQRLSVAEAVHCYTYCGAYTQFAEDRKGRLLPGMLADVTVLSRDIFAGAPEDILGTEADLVLRDGQAVFDRHGQFA